MMTKIEDILFKSKGKYLDFQEEGVNIKSQWRDLPHLALGLFLDGRPDGQRRQFDYWSTAIRRNCFGFWETNCMAPLLRSRGEQIIFLIH